MMKKLLNVKISKAKRSLIKAIFKFLNIISDYYARLIYYSTTYWAEHHVMMFIVVYCVVVTFGACIVGYSLIILH